MKKMFLSLVMLTLLGMSCVFAQSNRIWATYFGGPSSEYGCSVATDNSNNVYLAGNTYSTSGVAYGGFQNTFGGGSEDAFLIKLDAAGNRLWATYYGGPDNDEGDCLTVDTHSNGDVYVVGMTGSTSGIASTGCYQYNEAGSCDAFLVKFDPLGNRLWATYFGGSGSDYGYDVKTDAWGNVYITGRTNSTSGIATSGAFQNTFGGGSFDAFLAKFNSSGSLLWATYYGGSGDDMGSYIAIDATGNIYLSGTTSSSSGIASGGYQNSLGGGYDDFLVKFDPSGNRLWATYYGGTGDENVVHSVATDLWGNVYLDGGTSSTSGMASGGFQNTYGGGGGDAFLVKFNSVGNFLWATYYGGNSDDRGKGISTDSLCHVFLAGDTYSTNNIASGGFQNSLVGSSNVFLVEFDSLGNRLCSTYFGQSDETLGNDAIDRSGNVYLCGNTSSTSGIASGGFQNIIGGGQDAYLVKFSSCLNVLSATTVINHKACSDNCTGSATVNASGGSSPYTYVWITTPPQTTPTADSLCAGTYTVTITDGSGNSVTSSVVITHYPISVVTITEDTATLSLVCHPSFISYQWYLNGNIIPGATSQTYTPTHNGNYTVVAIDSNGCTATCIKFGVDWLGIIEFLNENNIIIYPNPANDIITIESNVAYKDLMISIYDIQGQLQLQQPLQQVKNVIDISILAKGVYVLKVETARGIVVKRFIKE